MKNPNASLKAVQAYSGYSSEAKTYLKRKVSEVGIKVMVYFAISLTDCPGFSNFAISGSVPPTELFAVEAF